ncbi:hypothetical protein, partial [Pseudomonas putida]
PKVVGSNPAPATKHQKRLLERVAFFVRVCFSLRKLSDKKAMPNTGLPRMVGIQRLICTYLTHAPING